MLNNSIWDHELHLDDEVIECIQEYIYFGQKIAVSPDHEK